MSFFYLERNCFDHRIALHMMLVGGGATGGWKKYELLLRYLNTVDIVFFFVIPILNN